MDDQGAVPRVDKTLSCPCEMAWCVDPGRPLLLSISLPHGTWRLSTSPK